MTGVHCVHSPSLPVVVFSTNIHIDIKETIKSFTSFIKPILTNSCDQVKLSDLSIKLNFFCVLNRRQNADLHRRVFFRQRGQQLRLLQRQRVELFSRHVGAHDDRRRLPRPHRPRLEEVRKILLQAHVEQDLLPAVHHPM